MVVISQTAWGYIVSVAGFVVFGGVVSPVNSYGRLFTAIQQDLNTTSVQAGWIGSVAWCCSFLGSPLAVFLVHHVGYRTATVLGAFLASTCYLATSFMNRFYGMLVFFGFILGIASSFCIHPVYSVVLRTLSSSHQNKGTALASCGASFFTFFVILAYEKMVPYLGWRRTLQYTSAFTAVVAIPPAFLISPHDKKWPIKRKTSRKTSTLPIQAEDNLTKESVSSISGAIDGPRSAKSVTNIIDQPKHKTWLRLLRLWRTWILFFAVMIPTMSWSVYWVNIISFYESLSVSADDILLYVSIQALSDLAGRVSLALFSSCLPRPINLLILSNFVFAIVTVLLSLVPSKPLLLSSSFLIGIGRGWNNVIVLKASADMLLVMNSDQAVTVALSALGVGFLVGTLPAGAIYDVTGSYKYAFILNAGFYLIGGALLIILHVLKEAKKKRRLSRMELTGIDNKIEVDSG